jgi:hypothetical protein
MASNHSVQNLFAARLLSKIDDLSMLHNNFTRCFYGYETWSLKSRKAHRLMVLESRVLKKEFVP